MKRLALVRHGKSVWNRSHRFTGWADVGLTPEGIADSERAGRALAEVGLRFDVCFTSVLERGVDAARHALRGAGCPDLPIHQHWMLNERHFGALQGLGRWQAVRRYGLGQVLRWQSSYVLSPPVLDPDDPRAPGHDPLYADVPVKDLPLAESLADTYARVIPYWEEVIEPELLRGRQVLVVAHKNTLRALMKRLEGLSEEETAKLHLPAGVPVLYGFGEQDEVKERRFLGGYRPRRFSFWRAISPA
ncbi:MAG: 2,3-bisphosphoglycerate-dependent phosphoglycerate mutase [Myxococcota bacterium]